MPDYTAEWDHDYSEERFVKLLALIDHLYSYMAEIRISFLRCDTLWRPEASADS